jgi:hypothetical protein
MFWKVSRFSLQGAQDFQVSAESTRRGGVAVVIAHVNNFQNHF